MEAGALIGSAPLNLRSHTLLPVASTADAPSIPDCPFLCKPLFFLSVTSLVSVSVPPPWGFLLCPEITSVPVPPGSLFYHPCGLFHLISKMATHILVCFCFTFSGNHSVSGHSPLRCLREVNTSPLDFTSLVTTGSLVLMWPAQRHRGRELVHTVLSSCCPPACTLKPGCLF